LQKFTSWLGKRTYVARLERLGIERIREIARSNGKKGGRPKKERTKVSVYRPKYEVDSKKKVSKICWYKALNLAF
jgi:hypothetical protein